MVQKNTYIDSIKLILIVLVVWGHTIDKCRFGGFKDDAATYEFIYLFHMPMFLFVSGYLTHIRDTKRFWRGMIRILETYIIIDLVRIFYVGGNVLWGLLIPQWTMWYLLTLLCYRILAYIGKELQAKYLIVMSILICLTGGFLQWRYTFALQRTFTFMPFFFLGYVLSRDGHGLAWIKKAPKWLAVCVLVIAYIVLCGINNDISPYLSGIKPYEGLGEMGWRVVQLAAASVVGFSFLSLVPDIKSYSVLGGKTLFIYIYHSFAIEFLFCHVPHWLNCDNSLVILLCAIINMCLLYLMSKIKLFTFILNPITNCIERKKIKMGSSK